MTNGPSSNGDGKSPLFEEADYKKLFSFILQKREKPGYMNVETRWDYDNIVSVLYRKRKKRTPLTKILLGDVERRQYYYTWLIHESLENLLKNFKADSRPVEKFVQEMLDWLETNSHLEHAPSFIVEDRREAILSGNLSLLAVGAVDMELYTAIKQYREWEDDDEVLDKLAEIIVKNLNQIKVRHPPHFVWGLVIWIDDIRRFARILNRLRMTSSREYTALKGSSEENKEGEKERSSKKREEYEGFGPLIYTWLRKNGNNRIAPIPKEQIPRWDITPELYIEPHAKVHSALDLLHIQKELSNDNVRMLIDEDSLRISFDNLNRMINGFVDSVKEIVIRGLRIYLSNPQSANVVLLAKSLEFLYNVVPEKEKDVITKALENAVEEATEKRKSEKKTTSEKSMDSSVAEKTGSTGLVATGYAALDNLLNGGLAANFAVTLILPPGDVREKVIRSFLETGARKSEPTFYLATEPSLAGRLAEEFPSNFYLFVCNPQAEAVAKSAPNVFTLRGVGNLTNINIALTQAIGKLDPTPKIPRRICIGLLSDILLEHGPVQARKWLTELLTQLRTAGFTTLALIDSQTHPSEHVHAVSGLFDGEIEIYEGSFKLKRMSKKKT